MSRTIEQIQADIITNITNTPELSYVDENNITRNITYNTSKRSKWRLWTYVVSVAIAIHEQIIDLYIATIEKLLAMTSAASPLWVQDKMFKFQYSVTDPQVIQLIDTVPQYPVVDPTKRIITGCSVTTAIDSTVNIKVAKGNPYVSLDALELAAAQSMITTIGIAGVDYVVTSGNADRLYISADVYYKGQYSAIIAQTTKDTLDAYFQTLSQINFNGSLKMTDLENTIRSITGVNDVVLINVVGRPDSPTPANPLTNPYGVYYIHNKTTMNRLFNPSAGYIIGEDVAGYTFLDSINFIAQ
jgi:hypothetical protein